MELEELLKRTIQDSIDTNLASRNYWRVKKQQTRGQIKDPTYRDFFELYVKNPIIEGKINNHIKVSSRLFNIKNTQKIEIHTVFFRLR